MAKHPQITGLDRKLAWVSDQVEAYRARRGYWPDVKYVQILTGYKDKKDTLRFIRRGVTKEVLVLTGDTVSNGALQVCEHCNGRGFVERSKF